MVSWLLIDIQSRLIDVRDGLLFVSGWLVDFGCVSKPIFWGSCLIFGQFWWFFFFFWKYWDLGNEFWLFMFDFGDFGDWFGLFLSILGVLSTSLVGIGWFWSLILATQLQFWWFRHRILKILEFRQWICCSWWRNGQDFGSLGPILVIYIQFLSQSF